MFTQLAQTTFHSELTVFAGDGVRLAGQFDFPHQPSAKALFPLVFVLQHSGSEDRSGYTSFAEAALLAGAAVFRWDKRGTGRSGCSGSGSTTQDAVNAYTIALEHANINHRRVVIVAQGAGTAMLGDSFGLFARVRLPHMVVLVSNMLAPQAITALDTRVRVLMGQQDWNPWQTYAQQACEAHNAAYKHGAQFYVAPYADRLLTDARSGAFHAGAKATLCDWLENIG